MIYRVLFREGPEINASGIVHTWNQSITDTTPRLSFLRGLTVQDLLSYAEKKQAFVDVRQLWHLPPTTLRRFTQKRSIFGDSDCGTGGSAWFAGRTPASRRSTCGRLKPDSTANKRTSTSAP